MIDATSLINGSTPAPGTTGTNNSTSSSPTTQRSDNLGRDAFLRLLTTQLAHQDPVEPQADGEFIAQLATFSSLEQLTEMRKTLDIIATALGVATGTNTTDGGDSTTTDTTGTSGSTDTTTAPPSTT